MCMPAQIDVKENKMHGGRKGVHGHVRERAGDEILYSYSQVIRVGRKNKNSRCGNEMQYIRHTISNFEYSCTCIGGI